MHNYGLDLSKEQADRKPTDYIFGAVSQPCLYNIPVEDRILFLPAGETQRGTQDFADCASRGPLNIVEAKLSYAYTRGLLKPENMRWLSEKGYVQNSRIVLSDRFIAIKSGTTMQGNSLIAPLDAIHRHGCIPKTMLPASSSMDWKAYHDKSNITPSMEALGKEFAARFVFNYERVFEQHFAELLKDDFVNVALYAWSTQNDNGEYIRTAAVANHIVAAFKLPKTYIFDNYTDPWDGDYVKKLAPDYDFFEYGYRCYFSAENTSVDIAARDNLLRTLMIQLLTLLRRQYELMRGALGYA